MQIRAVARASHGFVGADIHALCGQAALSTLRRYHQEHAGLSREYSSLVLPRVSTSDLEAARLRVKPSALREVALEIPRTRWEDIGGLEDVKVKLKEAVELPFKSGEKLHSFGAVAPKGISSGVFAVNENFKRPASLPYLRGPSISARATQVSCCMALLDAARPC